MAKNNTRNYKLCYGRNLHLSIYLTPAQLSAATDKTLGVEQQAQVTLLSANRHPRKALAVQITLGRLTLS